MITFKLIAVFNNVSANVQPYVIFASNKTLNPYCRL